MRKETKIVTIECDVCNEVTDKTVRRVDSYVGIKSRPGFLESFTVTINHAAYDPDICPACAEKILLDALSNVRKKMKGNEEEAKA